MTVRRGWQQKILSTQKLKASVFSEVRQRRARKSEPHSEKNAGSARWASLTGGEGPRACNHGTDGRQNAQSQSQHVEPHRSGSDVLPMLESAGTTPSTLSGSSTNCRLGNTNRTRGGKTCSYDFKWCALWRNFLRFLVSLIQLERLSSISSPTIRAAISFMFCTITAPSLLFRRHV